jgi:hypothetical protein
MPQNSEPSPSNTAVKWVCAQCNIDPTTYRVVTQCKVPGCPIKAELLRLSNG